MKLSCFHQRRGEGGFEIRTLAERHGHRSRSRPNGHRHGDADPVESRDIPEPGYAKFAGV
jgi:hypothetical protein